MRLPKNIVSQNVTVKRLIEGHTDETTGQWIDDTEATTATITNACVLPKSGNERAASSQTVYESNYALYAGSDDITFIAGYTDIEAGDIVIDSKGKRYQVTFPGCYGPAYQTDLKEL